MERFHQTLKRHLSKQPRPRTVVELQVQHDQFWTYDHEERPHRASGRRTPAQAFVARTRPFPRVPSSKFLPTAGGSGPGRRQRWGRPALPAAGSITRVWTRNYEPWGRQMVNDASPHLSRRRDVSRHSSVEVIRRYSNPPRRPADLRKLLTAAPVRDHAMPETRPPRQHQRRLRPDELARLVTDYVAGVEVMELVRRYGIARQTVFDQMRREGVPRRHPRLSVDETEKAAGIYRTGDSLATIGEVFGVDPGTVRRALIKLGVPMRDCHGREQTASS